MITEEQAREWKATAERYRAWVDNAMPWPARQRYERMGQLLSDRRIIADAYLALLGEDESERDERAARIANIEENLNTRSQWTLEDYQEFYERDVVFLLNALKGGLA